MRIVFVRPNYRSGGAEIAGSWPPAWVAYLAGHLRKVDFYDIHFIDAMTHKLPEDKVVPIKICGGGNEQLAEDDTDIAVRA